jgi:exopolysaccharide production protein ExoZ
MSKEILSIQYLRGVAALLVVFHHIFSPQGLGYIFLPWLGSFGVDIFFVISGFVMWHTTAGATISVFGFWRRRITRIVPLYWIFLTAVVFGAMSFPDLFHTTVVGSENTAKSFLFIPHPHVVQNMIAPILIPGWSLNYEMFFYFLFGLTLLASSRAFRVVLLGLLIFGLVLSGLVFEPEGAVIATYTSPALLKFFDGIILGVLYRSSFGSRPRPTIGVLLIVAGVVASLYHARTLSFIGFAPTMIVAGSLAFESELRRAPNSILHSIGDASYSIYLSHLFFIRALELGWLHFAVFGLSKAADAVYVIVALLFAVSGGVLVSRFVERPVLSLLQMRRVPILASCCASRPVP